MGSSAHHIDVPWCTVGPVSIFYHANISENISVSYDQRSVFGSHGAYAVWLGTEPRGYSVSANMVGANAGEVAFNLSQVSAAYGWTQQSPPACLPLVSPGYYATVRIEGYDSSIEEGVHIDSNIAIQISLSLTLKECKPI
jgi:hypothetical protein